MEIGSERALVNFIPTSATTSTAPLFPPVSASYITARFPAEALLSPALLTGKRHVVPAIKMTIDLTA